ncbi:hypothetical protein ACWD01_15695 [Streptomyces sp. NPDC002835]|jgi:hypothetical protein
MSHQIGNISDVRSEAKVDGAGFCSRLHRGEAHFRGTSATIHDLENAAHMTESAHARA